MTTQTHPFNDEVQQDTLLKKEIQRIKDNEELSKREISAVETLQTGFLPAYCPHCETENAKWDIGALKFEGGKTESHITCIECRTNILEKFGIDDNILIPTQYR